MQCSYEDLPFFSQLTAHHSHVRKIKGQGNKWLCSIFWYAEKPRQPQCWGPGWGAAVPFTSE